MLKEVIKSIVDIKKSINGILNIPNFLSDYTHFKQLGGDIKLKNLFPVLDEKTSKTSIDKHYFYQDFWAFKKILNSKIQKHFDIGSNNKYISLLTAITEVVFVDIRPLEANLPNLTNQKGSILELPFDTCSITSLSCLHVAEHIGLGRYGDPIDPKGTQKACRELERVLARNGNLYFGLPIGKPRICFNAHRIHNSNQILEYFSGLTLLSFSGVDDNGNFYENINVDLLDDSNYACGLFQFTKN